MKSRYQKIVLKNPENEEFSHVCDAKKYYLAHFDIRVFKIYDFEIAPKTLKRKPNVLVGFGIYTSLESSDMIKSTRLLR